MIKSTGLQEWLKNLSSTLKIKETAKAQLTEKAINRYYSLSKQGFFPNLMMTRRYRSGLLHIARVR